MFRPFMKHLLLFNTPWGSHFQASLRTFPSRWSNKKRTQFALFNDADVEETFIHGWGPGGQAINKTANCVRLTHFPTGITVKCQDSRDLQVNRIIARRRLEERLDVFYNGENSAIELRRKEAEIKENNRFSRAKRRLEMKAAWKNSLEENQPPN